MLTLKNQKSNSFPWFLCCFKLKPVHELVWRVMFAVLHFTHLKKLLLERDKPQYLKELFYGSLIQNGTREGSNIIPAHLPGSFNQDCELS